MVIIRSVIEGSLADANLVVLLKEESANSKRVYLPSASSLNLVLAAEPNESLFIFTALITPPSNIAFEGSDDATLKNFFSVVYSVLPRSIVQFLNTTEFSDFAFFCSVVVKFALIPENIRIAEAELFASSARSVRPSIINVIFCALVGSAL